MATTSIPWDTGGGNITLSYTGTGTGVVSITSDPNTLPTSRSKTVTFMTTGSNPASAILTITQSASSDLFLTTSSGDYFVTSGGDNLIAE